MIKLVLLRHGESIWNRENRFTGWTDVRLTPQGEQEAREAGRKGGMASHRRKQQQQGGSRELENPSDTGSHGAASDTPGE